MSTSPSTVITSQPGSQVLNHAAPSLALLLNSRSFCITYYRMNDYYSSHFSIGHQNPFRSFPFATDGIISSRCLSLHSHLGLLNDVDVQEVPGGLFLLNP